MLSSQQINPGYDEKDLSDAYFNFVQTVVNICSVSTSGIPAFFKLNYVRIEFVCLLQQKTIDQTGDNMLFARYLNKAIQIIDCALKWLNKNKDQTEVLTKKDLSAPLLWTGKTVDLIELAMSVHESGSVNNGEITVKAVVNLFCESFGVNPGNFSATYGIMRSRANSRTLFLDKLKRVFENKMDRDAEKRPSRKGVRKNSKTK
jgi:RteC protein.